eukprot:726320-Hanusia_phi.AAC.1
MGISRDDSADDGGEEQWKERSTMKSDFCELTMQAKVEHRSCRPAAKPTEGVWQQEDWDLPCFAAKDTRRGTARGAKDDFRFSSSLAHDKDTNIGKVIVELRKRKIAYLFASGGHFAACVRISAMHILINSPVSSNRSFKAVNVCATRHSTGFLWLELPPKRSFLFRYVIRAKAGTRQ